MNLILIIPISNTDSKDMDNMDMSNMGMSNMDILLLTDPIPTQDQGHQTQIHDRNHQIHDQNRDQIHQIHDQNHRGMDAIQHNFYNDIS